MEHPLTGPWKRVEYVDGAAQNRPSRVMCWDQTTWSLYNYFPQTGCWHLDLSSQFRSPRGQGSAKYADVTEEDCEAVVRVQPDWA